MSSLLTRRMHTFRRTPRLRKHKGYYYTIFYDPETRRRKWHALGTDKKDIASRRHHELMTAAERGDIDPMQDKYRFGAVTLQDAVRRFLRVRKPHLAERTYRDYETFLTMVVDMLPAGMSLLHLSSADCQRVVRRPPARATRRGYYRRLRVFLNWCLKHNLIKASPLDKATQPKAVHRPPSYLTRSEFAHFLATVNEAALLTDSDSERRRLIRLTRYARLAVATGMRLKEMCNLEWQDIDLDAGRIRVIGKGEKYRPVPLFPDAEAVLDELRDEHAEMFGLPPARTERVFAGLSYSGTVHDVTDYLRAAGLKHKAPNRATHLFRSTFASWLVSDGVSIFQVSRWMGHSSVQLTERHYAELAPDYVSEQAVKTFGG